MRLTLTLLGLGLALFSRTAQAWSPNPDQAKTLKRGDLVLVVKSAPDHVSGAIQAGIEIAATPDVVWAVLVDCNLATRMVPNLNSCRILERDPQGRFDIREHVSKPILFFPPIRNVFRSDYDPPHGISIHQSGGDFPVLEGQWLLIPLNHGTGTRALYEGRAAAPFAAPGPIVRLVLRDQMAEGLAALRRESLARNSRPIP